jgi:hypothetical protein
MRKEKIKKLFLQGAKCIEEGNKVIYPTEKDGKLVGYDVYKKIPNGFEMVKRGVF